MTQPSKPAAAFLFLFGTPFLAGGLFFAYAQLVSHENFSTGNLIASIAFALVFVCIGGGLMVGAIKGYGLMKQQAAREEANPLSPWLWRNDWASRRAESLNRKTQIGYWVLCILVNMILLPVVLGVAPKLMRDGDPRVLLPLGFSVIGLLLVANAVRATIRYHRFGDTYFEFDSLPFSPGERMDGRIQLKFETRAEHGIDLRLSCVRKVASGTGDSRSTSQIVLWQADQNVPTGAVGPGPLGRAIPVEFSIPAEALDTNHDNPNDQIQWLLHAQADVPGVDYKDDFELPVFKTAASTQSVKDSHAQSFGGSEIFGFASPQPSDAESGEVPKPQQTQVIVSAGSGGTEFYFPAFRNPGRAFVLFLVMVLWTGVAYALFRSHAPMFFYVLFGLSDVIVVWGFLHVTFGSSRIRVSSGDIFSRSGVFGLASTRRIQVSDVDWIRPVLSMQQGGNSNSSLYAIRLRTKSGKKITLADEIKSRQEARWVVSQIETLAGLKLDTHVDVDLPLGVSSQPPTATYGQSVFKSQRRNSAAVSVAIFFVFVTAMFGFMAWRMFSFNSRASATRAAASVAKPVPRRVFSAPLTDADVERLLSLPAQAQAEELLERSIGHDTRALELFDQKVEEWVGHIRLTPRMRQLEQRSRFSKDLRVRYANADIELALDGWHKDERAADLLIERARTDQAYRSAALYFLGMLAGRGVDYDRIHGVLLDYARNDKDTAVRQWAVEGMRFLGKDEVLDELFTSFTEDPSSNVRDRAGCNISDCGIFTRKQRLRMVPKLIDLTMNPHTNSQMCNWAFLALREITDENLPADGMVWNRWYAEHGAEKMEQFERLEWWQVRGDE